MTHTNTAQSDAGFFGIEQLPSAPWYGLGRAWADYRTYRAALGELRHLTDRQLGDLGFRRDALRSIARSAAYAK